MAVTFTNMNPLSRVWVFQANRVLSVQEQNFISFKVSAFINEWTTHGSPLVAAFEIKNNCSVIVAVDENIQSASGCSISSITSLFESLGEVLNLSFFDRFSIAHQSHNKVEVSTLKEFKSLISTGLVDEDTIVYNNLIALKEDLSSKWELPLKESWQKRYL